MISKKLAHEACETTLKFLDKCRGGFRGGSIWGTWGAQGALPYFLQEKIARKQKIQKHNVNKICPVEPSLKEMTCLMTIAETKQTFSAFQFSHKHYWNRVSGKLIAAARASDFKRSELWKSIKTLCALRKNHSSRTKAATEASF